MQITSTLILAVFGVSSVSARCYLGDYSWDFRDNAAYHAGRACRGYDGIAGAFQGWFAPGESRHVCVDGIDNIRYDFTIQNLNNRDGFDLGDEDCAYRLTQEIRNCQFGGESSVAGWWFKSDPNLGRC